MHYTMYLYIVNWTYQSMEKRENGVYVGTGRIIMQYCKCNDVMCVHDIAKYSGA